MAKKMTMKQFKELVDFDIYGWEGIVNQLIIYEKARARESRRLGRYASAKLSEESANKKYLVLKELGYYD